MNNNLYIALQALNKQLHDFLTDNSLYKLDEDIKNLKNSDFGINEIIYDIHVVEVTKKKLARNTVKLKAYIATYIANLLHIKELVDLARSNYLVCSRSYQPDEFIDSFERMCSLLSQKLSSDKFAELQRDVREITSRTKNIRKVADDVNAAKPLKEAKADDALTSYSTNVMFFHYLLEYIKEHVDTLI